MKVIAQRVSSAKVIINNETHASIKKGITAIYFNRNCKNKTMNESILLMKAVGETIIVDDELSLIHI